MRRQEDRQQGQVLVQVALLLVVLLGFLALAVDVSQVYLKRRQLQNAADAGALEGARQICFESRTWADARGPASAVALRNAPGGTVSFPAAASSYHMTVVVTQTIPSFVASVVGQDVFNPGARATAVCGGADTACGLWPISFDMNAWDELYDDGAGCGRTLYVWAGTQPDDPPGNQDPDCDIYDCDVDPSPSSPGNEFINQDGRSWLDFSDVTNELYGDTCAQSGCGMNELGCWLRSTALAQISIPGCVPGDSGVRAAARNDVNARRGDYVGIALFDPDRTCEASSCPGGRPYWIERLGCVRVDPDEPWLQNMTLPRLDGANPPWRGKAIKVQIACGGCNTACGSTSGIPPSPSGINAVSLIE